MAKTKILSYFLLLLFISVLSITVYSIFIFDPTPNVLPENLDEVFDPRFLAINSSGKLDSLIENKFRSSHYDTAKTVFFIDQFLRKRFYHSYSEYTLKDNWLAVLLGKLIWSHILYPVVPKDIVKYPVAACSQQGILFQEQLAKLNIECSTIQFLPLQFNSNGHYAVSVYYDNSWHYYDSNQEPRIIDSTMPSIEKIIDEKLYYDMYSSPSNIKFRDFFAQKSYRRVAKVPFSKGKMHYLQICTSFLSRWLWLFCLATFLLFFLRNRRNV